MPARDAAARARPAPLVRLQPDAHAVRVPVDFPVMAEEEGHVVGGEVVGIRLRAADRRDLPALAVGRAPLRVEAVTGGVPAGGAERYEIALLEGAPAEAAEAADGERRTAAQILRDVDPAAHRDVGAEAPVLGDAEGEHVAGLHRHSLPGRNRLAVERRAHVRTGYGDHPRLAEAGPEAARSDLEGRGARGVPGDEVRGAEREVVHRPGGVNAEVEVPDAPRNLLDRRLHAAFEHLQCHPSPPRYGTGTVRCAASCRRRKASASARTSSRKRRYSRTSNESSAMS